MIIKIGENNEIQKQEVLCLDIPDKNKLNNLIDILNFLKERESIKIVEEVEKENVKRISINFLNFVGFFKYNDTNYLVIPEKLLKLFKLNLEENNIFDIFESYKEIFSSFFKYILEELSKEDILFTLGLTEFPVDEYHLSESKIFKLLLLLRKKQEIIDGLNIIMADIHRKLLEQEVYKPFYEVNFLDADIILDIIKNPENLFKDSYGLISFGDKKYTPKIVLQYEVEESYDTLENRFIKHFLKELEYILSDELEEFMSFIDLQELKGQVNLVLRSSRFENIGEMTYFPSNSQVLMKKAGYREIFQIYRLLHLSFIPKILSDLDLSFSLKDMATLWEYYVLVELIKELKSDFGGFKININFEERTYEKTKYEYAEFEFNNGLKLYYQKSIKSYSGFEYRPDFYIEYNSEKFIFDAKFRFFENNSEERKKEIINNMHYYRDALGATFAVAVCLAEDNKKSVFFGV